MSKKSKQKDTSLNENRKVYAAPKLTEYGSIAQMTRSNTSGSQMDGGTSPSNREPKVAMEMCIGTVSALEEHHWLLVDKTCQDLFKEAIGAVVKPGDIVLDLGCGSGIHSFFACEAGAKKVYAVDSDSIIELAREAALQNGFAEKIDFRFGHSSSLELPEKVDVIVTNIGFLPTLEHLPDVCKRYLAPNGTSIPGSIRVGFAPIDHSSVLDGQVMSWATPHLGYDFSEFKQYAENRPWYDHLDENSFLSELTEFPAMDLKETVANSHRWEAEHLITRDGMCTALGGWYSFQLAPDLVMSTRPPLQLSPKIWFNPVLPLVRPLELKKGDILKMRIGFFRAHDPIDPIWSWELEHNGVRIEQNSFEGIPLSKDLLKKLKPDQLQIL